MTNSKPIFDLHKLICSEDWTPEAQLISSFCFGILFSPWSYGLFFLLIFFIIYEVLFYWFTWGDSRYWQLETRLTLFLAYFAGWIIARTLLNDDVLERGVPFSDDDYVGYLFPVCSICN